MNNYFIVNKASKSGRAEKDWERLEEYLKAHNIAYEARITTGRGVPCGSRKYMGREFLLSRRSNDVI